MVQFKEEGLVRDDKLMIVKNCYQFVENVKGLDYIANGDMARLVHIGGFEERYGLHFADARLYFPDYDAEVNAKVCLDTLESEAATLSYEQQNALYQGSAPIIPTAEARREYGKRSGRTSISTPSS